jgi:type II secretory pathway predicted ATPase ExeA
LLERYERSWLRLVQRKRGHEQRREHLVVGQPELERRLLLGRNQLEFELEQRQHVELELE